jgi:cell division protein FtsL
MEDFIRLNLMSLISFAFFLVVIFIAYILVTRYIKECSPVVKKIVIVIIVLVLISCCFSLIRQIAVNQTPRSIIDRTYQNDVQQQYQNNLKKGVKQ